MLQESAGIGASPGIGGACVASDIDHPYDGGVGCKGFREGPETPVSQRVAGNAPWSRASKSWGGRASVPPRRDPTDGPATPRARLARAGPPPPGPCPCPSLLLPRRRAAGCGRAPLFGPSTRASGTSLTTDSIARPRKRWMSEVGPGQLRSNSA